MSAFLAVFESGVTSGVVVRQGVAGLLHCDLSVLFERLQDEMTHGGVDSSRVVFRHCVRIAVDRWLLVALVGWEAANVRLHYIY